MSRTVRSIDYKRHHPYGHVAMKGGMAVSARTANLWCWCCRPKGNGKHKDAERRKVKRRERQQWKQNLD